MHNSSDDSQSRRTFLDQCGACGELVTRGAIRAQNAGGGYVGGI